MGLGAACLFHVLVLLGGGVRKQEAGAGVGARQQQLVRQRRVQEGAHGVVAPAAGVGARVRVGHQLEVRGAALRAAEMVRPAGVRRAGR